MANKRFVPRWGVSILLLVVCLTLVIWSPARKADAATIYFVSAYGAVGDGNHDDGPAIEAAIQAAVEASGLKTVSFDAGKTYRIGNKEDAYTYFKIFHASDVTIEGNGATLLFEPNNYPFLIEDSVNLTLKDLKIDYRETTAAEGEIIAIDRSGRSFDVRLSADSPEPPTDSFVLANGKYPTSGPVHGIVFKPDDYVRETTGDRNFFNPVSITDQGNRIFRFVMPGDSSYGPFMNDLQMSDRATYNFADLKLTPAEKALKANWYKEQDPGSSRVDFAGASFKITTSSIVALQNVDSYFSPAMFAVVYNNNGTISFNGVHMKRKPGTDRLMANGSDGIHVNNNRGSIVVDGCYLEGANDDLINISTLGYKVGTISSPNTMVLKTTGLAVHYDYTIKVDDSILFTDFDHSRTLGNAKVTAVSRLSNGVYQVTLDQTPAGVASGTKVFDMNQVSPDSRIVNSTFRPVMRQAMLVRMNGGTISNNRIEGLGGIGITLSDTTFLNSAEGILAHDFTISNNVFDRVLSWGITMTTAMKDFNNLHPANLVIANNTMTNHQGNGINLSNMKNVRLQDNRIEMDPQTPTSFKALRLSNIRNAVVSGLTVIDPRPDIGVAAQCSDCEQSSMTVDRYDAHVADGVVPFNLSERVDDAYASISYNGNWGSSGTSSDYGGTLHTSATADNTATFTFTGNSISYFARKGPGAGIAEVSIDGNPAYTRTIDLYSAAAQYLVPVYQTSGLRYAQHTITVRVTGDKNPSSSGNTVGIDGFLLETAQNRVDGSDVLVDYNGTWGEVNYPQDFNGGIRFSSKPGDYAELIFTGNAIKYGARKGPSMGIVAVTIDGGAPQLVDLYAPAPTFQTIAYEANNLSYGQHTVRVALTGTNNESAYSASGNVDFFQIPVDQTPPELSVTLDKPVIWPPNSRMGPITATIQASDSGSGVAAVTLLSIVSNEPVKREAEQSDENATTDIQAALGTSATTFALRAEMNHDSTPRIYTITYQATDFAGNVTTKSTTVTVQNGQGNPS